MATNESLALGMLKATQLTRAGRLHEATAAIQRALRRQPVADEGATGRVIEGEFSRVEEPSQRQAANDVLEGRPGQFIAGSYSHQHGTRAYKLYIPTGYAAGKALPLVVMLHGCTQNPDDFAAGTRMNLLAEERQCFVLYPAQTRSANRSQCWNWFKRAHQRRDKGEPAIIAGMTREVLKRYGVDAHKVYVAGLSAGGAMAAVMGAAYPDVYAAVGIHSGLPVGSAHDIASAFAAMRGAPPASPSGAATGRVVPAIVFHGDRDATVHPRNGEQVVSQCVDRHDESIDVVVERGQVAGGHAYTRRVHRDAAGRIVLEHWEVHGAGHAWCGGSAAGSYTDPKGPDAAREMLRFFLLC
ncbi:MAG TPA: PHB depolymerase family esterase [Burkholderiales bacterium]|nr:PHB depolymerase family esterase [Burkholderiales bacterium]